MKEADYQDESQQFIARPKPVSSNSHTCLHVDCLLIARTSQAPKAPRPQSFNYAPAVVEKRKPAYAPAPAPAQYYDYEEEAQTTPRPIQIARQKYSFQAQPPRQPQFGNDAGVVYAQERQAAPPAAQYQQFDNRQPLQFPNENASPAPVASRAEQQFSLFSPASRSDTFKPRVRRAKFRAKKYLRRVRRRRRKPKNVIFVVKKKRKYHY